MINILNKYIHIQINYFLKNKNFKFIKIIKNKILCENFK